MRFLSFGLDKCVHGAYIISLELYDPYSRQFMTNVMLQSKFGSTGGGFTSVRAVAPDARQR